MSDYPMLISNKLHSFRNFALTNIHFVCVKTIIIRKYSLTEEANIACLQGKL